MSGEGAGSGDFREDEPAVTSRLSVKRVVEVVGKFDEYKRWLVSEIGFGGILKLPMIAKLDLKMSAWVMRQVKVRSCVIDIGDGEQIAFTTEDFHKIFGIPCGNRHVCGRDAHVAASAIEFVKKTIGMDGSVAQNLKVAEIFVSREITEDSSKIEKDCFQIAFVIVVMGFMIAPCTKHDTMTIDFWGALANPELIAQFNWCECAIQKLLAAVVKLQNDYENNAATVDLCGCHLFLQIFLLDNIELGLFNMPHSILPRVQVFNQKLLRQMITMAYCMRQRKLTYVPAGVRSADLVCYTRMCLALPAAGQEPETREPAIVVHHTPGVFLNVPTHQPQSLGDARSACQSLGPREFANHLRESCDGDPVLEEMSLMLKQQNAKCTLNMSLMRNKMQADMLSFADRMVSFVRDRCRCCQSRGVTKCITLARSQNDLSDAHAMNPTTISKVARRLVMSDDEGGSSGKEHTKQKPVKRPCGGISGMRESDASVVPSQLPDAIPVYENPVVEQRVMEVNSTSLGRITVYSQVIADMVRSLYDTAEEEPSVVYFGNMDAKLPNKKYVKSASFARNPWTSGCVPQPPPIPLVSKFNSWLSGGNDFHIDSVWFEHRVPRMLRVNAVCVYQQVVGTHPLDHEVAVLALRRFC